MVESRATWRRIGPAAIVLVVVILAVWFTAARRHKQPPRPRAVVSVLLDDFHVHRTTATAASGMVRFQLVNNGPSTHEFIVVRTDRAPAHLPLQRDGLTVDEEGPGVDHVDEAEGLDLGDRRTLTLDLGPGHYVLFCNMEGHYLGGMYAAFTVR
jgi:Sulfocyanin (SoxE) domain